jgi:hypothetical protein
MSDSLPVLIIPVLNRFDLLERVLDSIDFPIDNILIIDNSNSYKTNRDVKVFNMPSNLGVAASWNLGIKCYPHAPYWVIGSNDNIFVAGSLKKILEASSPDKLVMTGQAWNTFSIGSNIVKKIGLFDENYYPAYHEDTDYMERIRLHDMNSCIDHTTIPIDCVGMGTTMHSDPLFLDRNKKTGELNRQYYMQKIYGEEQNYDCYNWDLQRRIDQDWTINESTV